MAQSVAQSAKYRHNMGGLAAFSKMQADEYNLLDPPPEYRRHADTMTKAMI